MGFVTPDFGHWAGLLEAKGPPKEGRGRNFREAHERQKEGERCQKEGFGYRFGGFLEGKKCTKKSVSEGWHSGCRWVAEVVYGCLIAF